MTKKVIGILLLISLARVSYAQESKTYPNSLKFFSDHLEFLGYEVLSSEEEVVQLNHDTYPSERLLAYEGGVLISSFWTISEMGKMDIIGIHNFINNLNHSSVVRKYYIDEDEDLVLEAWYPGEYDKTRFALFIKTLQTDWDDILDDYNKELQLYIK